MYSNYEIRKEIKLTKLKLFSNKVKSHLCWIGEGKVEYCNLNNFSDKGSCKTIKNSLWIYIL